MGNAWGVNMGSGIGRLSRYAALAFALAVTVGACTSDKGEPPEVLGKQFERETAEETTTSVQAETSTTGAPATSAPVVKAAPASARRTSAAPKAPAAAPANGKVGWELAAGIASANNVPTYDPVTFSVTVKGTAGPVKAVELDFGDGTTSVRPERGGGVQLATCDESAPRGPSDGAYTFSHGYRRPGTYPVRIKEIVLECGGQAVGFDDGKPMALNVVAGKVHSNGPELPDASSCIINPHSFCANGEGLQGRVSGAVFDDDGFVQAVRVDWGDGSPQTETRYPLAECKDPIHRWTKSGHTLDQRHIYAVPGSYEVKLTIVSSGCDGADVQTTTLSSQLDAFTG